MAKISERSLNSAPILVLEPKPEYKTRYTIDVRAINMCQAY